MFIPFSNIKKAYLQILKNLTQVFVYSFFQYQKSILPNPKKPNAIVYLFVFQILKKDTYTPEKNWRKFLLIRFWNIIRAYLQILKSLTQFFAERFYKYLKAILTHPKTSNAFFRWLIFQILKNDIYKSYTS